MKTLIFNTVAGEVQALYNQDYEITEMRICGADRNWQKAEIVRNGKKQNGFYYIGLLNNCAAVRIFLNAAGEWKCEEMTWRDCPKVS